MGFFAVALIATLVFTGCGQSQNDAKTSSIEGVWRLVSGKILKGGEEENVEFPLPDKDDPKGRMQPYVCFSEGKVYMATKTEGFTEPDNNAISRDDDIWNIEYTFKDNTITAGEETLSCTIDGNKAKLTFLSKGPNAGTQINCERVSSPTIAEIKAAKEN